MHKTPAHVLISWVFLVLIAAVFAYSFLFYPDIHPVDCVISKLTGKDCPTCGFSRSFSLYTRFYFNEGKKFNAYSWPVFLFFVLQFMMRSLVICRYYYTRKNLHGLYIKSDVIISISGFLLAFLPILFKI